MYSTYFYGTMVYHFAEKELADARQRVETGFYYAAAQFVSNAKADIEAAPFEFGIWKDEFDKYHDEFQRVAATDTPNEGQLDHCLNKLELHIEKMKAIRAREDPYYNPDVDED